MNVTQFTNAIKGVAKPTLFDVYTSGCPAQPLDQELFKFTCKATNLPASTIGVIELPYKGRKSKIPGDRTWADWSTTVIGTNTWQIYNQLLAWHEKINSAEENVMSSSDYSQYKADVKIVCQDETGAESYSVTLQGAWPTEVSQIELGWDQNDTAMEISVTWAFDNKVNN